MPKDEKHTLIMPNTRLSIVLFAQDLVTYKVQVKGQHSPALFKFFYPFDNDEPIKVFMSQTDSKPTQSTASHEYLNPKEIKFYSDLNTALFLKHFIFISFLSEKD